MPQKTTYADYSRLKRLLRAINTTQNLSSIIYDNNDIQEWVKTFRPNVYERNMLSNVVRGIERQYPSYYPKFEDEFDVDYNL